MPEPFVHEGNMLDQYQVFVIYDVTEAKEVKAVEIRPGNNAVDHRPGGGHQRAMSLPKPKPWMRPIPIRVRGHWRLRRHRAVLVGGWVPAPA